MNPLQRAIIEKVGNDNGFEHVLVSDADSVTLASARHSKRASIHLDSGMYCVHLHNTSQTLLSELQRSFTNKKNEPDSFYITTDAELASLLRRAFVLSCALPTQVTNDYQQAVEVELSNLPINIVGTEVERMVRQRIGQNKFRQAMLVYWGGACAVTGVAIPDVLRASHAKPWVECVSDAERLDVYNGFLLNANLDALFDRFLISFDEQGNLLISSSLSQVDLLSLGIKSGLKLRWINPLHQPYLAFHRARFK